MAYSYDRRSAKTLALSEWNLEGMTEGRPVRLYHGTTRSFRTFSMERSRTELVDNYYGSGIFLTPSKRVAEQYAEANRNIGFDPEILGDLKQRNPNAGAFLQALYDHGKDGWETYWKDHGFWNEDAPSGEPKLDLAGFEKHLGGLDPNTLGDIAGYIIGSKTKPLGMGDDGGTIDIFNMSTGAPDWIYKALDEVGLDSSVYRPKVYTVEVSVENPLVTKSKSQARSARSKGYDSVVYYGSDLVQGVPEVAVFNPRNVRITHVEVV